jgi:glutaredoxin-related protein
MPQIYVQGELIGGSDIVMEMLQDGSLQEMFDEGRSA